jgi:hypothetical protein
VGIAATLYYFWEIVHKTRYESKINAVKGEEHKLTAKLGTAVWIIVGFGCLLVVLSAVVN